ncbi:Histidinol dehydrogenase [Buchnera aphidicola (Tetraneura ulmi)]|uniref:histidinol dehydrogenase n=1 Tax=Buchnera aphidicola TaxID=9 RepID=UPI0034645E36
MLKNVFFWKELDEEQKKRILSRPNIHIKKKYKKLVRNILFDVFNYGDLALKKYCLLFDKIKIEKFKIEQQIVLNSHLNVSENFKKSILHAKKNIEYFHGFQKKKDIDVEIEPGVRCQHISIPIDSVGLYIPGGSSPLVSTVLMLAIPAKIAGCRKIILCSPPPISNEILYCAYICGIQDIYQIGGSQAIAAMAFGTESIPKVQKIFGPGNVYVTEAKIQINNFSEGVSIDMPAGPSEILVIADKSANPDFIASDLLSQSEHGMDSQSIFISPEYTLVKQVISSISTQMKNFSKLDLIFQSMENSRFIVSENLLECIKISNIYAPEHLIIQTLNSRKLLKDIINAGSIFLGKWSPESVGDYASGSNHVLPTNGYSSSYSGLRVFDFQKDITVQELTRNGLVNLSSTILKLASFEKMDAHKNSVLVRIKED